MNKSFVWLAVLGTAYGVPGTQTSNATDEQRPPIIVTATRTAETADESLASVTVITREEIDKTGAQSMAEVLNGVAGLDVTTSGGYGQFTSVFMRGTHCPPEPHRGNSFRYRKSTVSRLCAVHALRSMVRRQLVA